MLLYTGLDVSRTTTSATRTTTTATSITTTPASATSFERISSGRCEDLPGYRSITASVECQQAAAWFNVAPVSYHGIAWLGITTGCNWEGPDSIGAVDRVLFNTASSSLVQECGRVYWEADAPGTRGCVCIQE